MAIPLVVKSVWGWGHLGEFLGGVIVAGTLFGAGKYTLFSETSSRSWGSETVYAAVVVALMLATVLGIKPFGP